VLDFLGVRPLELPGDTVANQGSYEPMCAETRVGLENRYAAPNARLVELLGRDFEWTAQGEAASAQARDRRH
jgi:hypothetical protein